MSEGLSERASEGRMPEISWEHTSHTASKRVRDIFAVMTNRNRIDIMRILNARGPQTYSELKSLAGFRSKKESGKFAYHLRKLGKLKLVALNRIEHRYTLTNRGKLVLTLMKQLEDRSMMESGKTYVRSSDEMISEFNADKITESLLREGGMPPELAQKTTEEAENRLTKHQPSYLTAALIREQVNSILIENGHEEYRNKMARLGMPVFDISSMLSNTDAAGDGLHRLLLSSGRRIMHEYLLTTSLTKNITDMHLAGDVHLDNTGEWQTIPDTVFVHARDLLDDGISLGGKCLGVSRAGPGGDLSSSLAVMLSLLAREASTEVVIDGLPQALPRSRDLRASLARAFSAASASLSQSEAIVSIRVPLSSDAAAASALIDAYAEYVKATPVPSICLIIDHEKGGLEGASERLASIVASGGMVAFGRGRVSSHGIANHSKAPSSLQLQSVTVNLPRLALSASHDPSFFRARLVLLLDQALVPMEERKKDVTDMIRRGLSPVLASNTQYMHRGSVAMVVNLVGLDEAVVNILGNQPDRQGHRMMYKVVETAVDKAAKKTASIGSEVSVSLVRGGDPRRFAAVDIEKYGKNAVFGEADMAPYSEGVVISAESLASMTPRSDKISLCTKMHRLLKGNLLVRVSVRRGTPASLVRAAIEKAASLLPSFCAVAEVPLCGECGFKGDGFAEKCPKCKSSYILLCRPWERPAPLSPS